MSIPSNFVALALNAMLDLNEELSSKPSMVVVVGTVNLDAELYSKFSLVVVLAKNSEIIVDFKLVKLAELLADDRKIAIKLRFVVVLVPLKTSLNDGIVVKNI